MIQREVTDEENIKWTCVQAYSGMQGKLAERATDLAENGDGKVTVVCTPTGGAQTVRLELQADWTEHLKDEELVKSIVTTK